MIKSTLAVLIILFSINAQAIDNTAKTTLSFGKEPYKIEIVADKNLIRKKDAAFDKALLKEDAEGPNFAPRYVYDVKLSATDKNYYRVVCNDDPSADPHCRFISEICKAPIGWEPTPACKAGEQLFVIGTEFKIPGNGCIYSSGIMDANFNEHRLYCTENNLLTERKQDYLYVGLKSKTRVAINICSDLGMTRLITTIPKNDFVEVLLHYDVKDKDDTDLNIYYVRNSFGIGGWAQIKTGAFGNKPEDQGDVVGLFYNGD